MECYLGNGHFKVLLSDVHSPLPESIHTSLCAHSLSAMEGGRERTQCMYVPDMRGHCIVCSDIILQCHSHEP